jgi:predicted 3-demethylubiquinone-9 3-methyltransferase (glyoxalase superfamily)
VIVGNGGTESQRDLCKNEFGLSWQISRRALLAAVSDPVTAAAKRAMEAMMNMKRIDIDGIECARAEETADA